MNEWLSVFLSPNSLGIYLILYTYWAYLGIYNTKLAFNILYIPVMPIMISCIYIFTNFNYLSPPGKIFLENYFIAYPFSAFEVLQNFISLYLLLNMPKNM